MDKEKVMSYFQTQFSDVKDIVCKIAMWADTPDKDTCEELGRGLIKLANNGEKRAAALYCLITAYDNHAGGFSADIASQLIFDMEAMDVYHELLEEELEGIVDADFYDYMYAFPVIHALKELSDSDKSKTAQDKQDD